MPKKIITEEEKKKKKRDDYSGKTQDQIHDLNARKRMNLTGCNPEMRKRAKERLDARKALMHEKELDRLAGMIDIPSRLSQLDRMGIAFLKGRKKFDKDQASIWRSMFETYSDKILSNAPTRKKTEEDDTKPTFSIAGLPGKNDKATNIEEIEELEDGLEDEVEEDA